MSITRKIEGDFLILQDTEGGESTRIRETIADGRARLEPEGRLAQEMAQDLEDELTSMALMCSHVTIDMTGVKYISSSVIYMILKIQHIFEDKDKTLLISGVSDSIWTRFQDLGLQDSFEMERIQEFTQ